MNYKSVLLEKQLAELKKVLNLVYYKMPITQYIRLANWAQGVIFAIYRSFPFVLSTKVLKYFWNEFAQRRNHFTIPCL